MKRGIYIIILLILLSTTINAATSQETGISVTVTTNPILEIISPQSITYQENENI